MSEFLEMSVDKFIFKIATDCFYSSEGMWLRPEGGRIRTGLSDFLQQRSGDVAFAEVKPAGTKLVTGAEVATIETIKVNIELTSPIAGTVIEVNPAMQTAPEVINQDPYKAGWLAVIEPSGWEDSKKGLLDPQAYLALIKGQAEEEAGKS